MISPAYNGTRWLDDIHPIATERLRQRVKDGGATPMPCYHCGVGDQLPGSHICEDCQILRPAIADDRQLSLL